ncbi:hypothetical protein DFH08DRAFT_812635 [Mycena albidolilacea]|uniref:Uncharacterized protein n=1 Tax=Mycena albidolilacea TaxID=1033008 RepID=A0AAD6ZTS6_9AGAR|nr:hypothetical protein DFH08DRAFT_812635 [Mycena albidolilacea]
MEMERQLELNYLETKSELRKARTYSVNTRAMPTWNFWILREYSLTDVWHGKSGTEQSLYHQRQRSEVQNEAPDRHRAQNSRIFLYKSQVTGGIYETLKQVTEMLEKGSKNGFFTSMHVQLSSDAAAFIPTVNFNILVLVVHMSPELPIARGRAAFSDQVLL